MAWPAIIASILTIGFLGTWAAYDIFKRGNCLTQATSGRSNEAASPAGSGKPQGILRPGVQSVRHRHRPDQQEGEHTCSICLEAFQHQALKMLPCRNHFHASCIEEWLRRGGRRASCPLCMTPVFEGQA
ncbi:g10580 [Coccomyxa viridis]|uniref:RING-type E3 ubiquitin transferase n=1 Tax=Coccomyxa viridis TaxID=1274662 RepID=A0ABP1G8D1_9CHLO